MNVKTTASNVEMDFLKNWAWMPPMQSFVYAGLRASSATIDFTSTQKITTGKFQYKDMGTIDVSTNSLNEYHAVISNPEVYHRIQIAKVKQTFPGDKYSNGWITRGDSNIAPIVLPMKNGDTETWKIQPHQWFWDRWLGDEMPWLSLVLNKGSLCVRYTRGIESTLIPLDSIEKDSQWKETSFYVIDFPVGDFKQKFVVLDIEATRDGSSIVIKHARIRYPEVRLDINNG